MDTWCERVVNIAIARLKVNEGFRKYIYVDITGERTIGYGTNLEAGISEETASLLLAADTESLANAISAFDWAQGLDDARLSVVIEIAYNVGLAGLLKFQYMIRAIRSGNWQNAHDELLNSSAARLLPVRYTQLASILLSGVA